MWSHHQCHPGFLPEVLCAMTSLSAGPEAVHWELVPSVGLGKPFPPGLAGRGSWEVALCDSPVCA